MTAGKIYKHGEKKRWTDRRADRYKYISTGGKRERDR